MKSIFFVIPVYKVEPYIRRCVDSVIAQTYENVKIVLVDDGSPDNCPQICDDYAEKYNNIAVIHKQNGGLSDARNAGIEYVLKSADGDDYITFLDSDDFVHPEYSRKMIGLCENNFCDFAQCGYEKGGEDVFSEGDKAPNVVVTSAEDALLGYTLKSSAWAKIYKVKAFDDILYPMGVLNEDEFTTYRAVYKSKKVAFTNEKLYYYYQSGKGIMVEIAKKLKNNPRRHDYLEAYRQRIEFFEAENKPLQVMKTHEKICTDIILRYCEQMYLKKEERDTDCVDGTYMRIYRNNYKIMIKRRGIPPRRKLMYIAFNYMPVSGVIMGKIFTLRK